MNSITKSLLAAMFVASVSSQALVAPAFANATKTASTDQVEDSEDKEENCVLPAGTQTTPDADHECEDDDDGEDEDTDGETTADDDDDKEEDSSN